jgi:hypothetical protein
MRLKNSVKLELIGENEVVGENLSKCLIMHHKFLMTSYGIEPGTTWREAGDDEQSYGTALRSLFYLETNWGQV